MSEGVGYRFCCDVDDGDCHWPTGKAIDYGQQVAETVGRCEGNQVHVEMCKSLRWNFKITNWRGDVAGDLGLLAGDALAGPSS